MFFLLWFCRLRLGFCNLGRSEITEDSAVENTETSIARGRIIDIRYTKNIACNARKISYQYELARI